jgi:pimeloyl-ACP methyl ester carboxylesterase
MSQAGPIHYEAAGDGPVLLLIHGYGFWGDWWSACGYLDALAGSFRVVAVDAPGHASSSYSTDPEDYEMDRVVGHLLGVVEAEGGGDFIAWGHGTGGTAVQALVHTGRVSKLISGACTLAVPTELYEAWAMPLIEEAGAGDWTALKQRIGESPEGLPTAEEVHDLTALSAFLRGNPWSTTADRLRATGVPMLAYMGEKDPALAFGPPQAEAAGATFATVPGGIRASFVNRDAVLDVVRPFLTT